MSQKLKKIYSFKLNLKGNLSINIPNISFYQNDTKACVIEIELNNDTTYEPIDLAQCTSIYIPIKYGKFILELTEKDYVCNGNIITITLPSYCIEHIGQHLIQITLYGKETLSFPILDYVVEGTLDGFAVTKTDKLNYTTEILRKQNEYQKNLDENYYTSKEVDEKVKEAQGINPEDYAKKDHTHDNYADKKHTHNYMIYYENPVEGITFNNGDIICRDVEVGGTM
ncbi:hypothetical protein [Paraclostridium sordellii]|uniref:hypothetical protein n=1 Tax=Paraclostridium sordellii TaxID=1505 RepID=UPI0022DF4F4C|nr:hypothetical protein [Paeniclostridium sordellii]